MLLKYWKTLIGCKRWNNSIVIIFFFFSVTRQMKTITYSLASTKCMEEGWTVRPQSPSAINMEHTQDKFVIEVNPLPLVRKLFDNLCY